MTPKMTRPHGPAMRGSRLSRASRSGFWPLATGTGLIRLSCGGRPGAETRASSPATVRSSSSQRLGELLDALVLEQLRSRRRSRCRAASRASSTSEASSYRPRTVSPVMTPWSATASSVVSGIVLTVSGGDELGDVERVRVGRVLDAGRGPQRALRPGRRRPRAPASARCRRPPRRPGRRGGRWRWPALPLRARASVGADRVEPLVDLGVDAGDEERRDRMRSRRGRGRRPWPARGPSR